MSDGKPLIQCFADDLNILIDKYRDQGVTFGEAIGAMEIAKLDLWHESQHKDESEDKSEQF